MFLPLPPSLQSGLPTTPAAAAAAPSTDQEGQEHHQHQRLTPPPDHRQVIVTPLLDCPAELAKTVLNDPSGRKITVAVPPTPPTPNASAAGGDNASRTAAGGIPCST